MLPTTSSSAAQRPWLLPPMSALRGGLFAPLDPRPAPRLLAQQPQPSSSRPAAAATFSRRPSRTSPPGHLSPGQRRRSAAVTSSTSGAAAAAAGGSSSSNNGSAAQGGGSGAAPASSSGGGGGDPGAEAPQIRAQENAFQLKFVHVFLFSMIFIGGFVFAVLTLQFTANMEYRVAVDTIVARVAKSIAFRQLVVITAAILLVRFGLNNVLKAIAAMSSIDWDKSKLYYILSEVYQPLELLLFIAGLCTLADAFLPTLIAVPKATVTHMVKATLSLSFILGAATVIFKLKDRFFKERAWNCEMSGDVTSQRRWEAYDKLGTFAIYVFGLVMAIQAVGVDLSSVLAIGGIGGLAIGLAGREICENILNGFLIMSTSPFQVGDEIVFYQGSKTIDGIVVDVGWYRTLVRSFEREVYVIPNAVFSKNVVLNVTRKNREWRFYEMLHIRVADVQKANQIVTDIRRIVRGDARILNKPHKRIFLDKVTPESCVIYLSLYMESANRDAFMAIKQDLLLAFIDCVERNGAQLATPKRTLDMEPELSQAVTTMAPALVAASNLYKQRSEAAGPSGPTLDVPLLPMPEATVVPVTPIPVTPSGGGGGNGNNGGGGGGGSGGGTTWTSGGPKTSGVADVSSVAPRVGTATVAAAVVTAVPGPVAVPVPGPVFVGAATVSPAGTTSTANNAVPAAPLAGNAKPAGAGAGAPEAVAAGIESPRSIAPAARPPPNNFWTKLARMIFSE